MSTPSDIRRQFLTFFRESAAGITEEADLQKRVLATRAGIIRIEFVREQLDLRRVK